MSSAVETLTLVSNKSVRHDSWQRPLLLPGEIGWEDDDDEVDAVTPVRAANLLLLQSHLVSFFEAQGALLLQLT